MKDLDIKDIWNQADNEYSFDHSQEVINEFLEQKPKNIVDRFILMLKIEMWFNVTTLFGVSILLAFYLSWIWIPLVTAVNILAYLYYKKLINRLNDAYIDSNVVQYLRKVHGSIDKFINHYKVAIWVIVIPAFILGMYAKDASAFSVDHILSIGFLIKTILGLALAISVAYIVLYFWYGRRANRIKEMVKSLEKEENNSAD